MQRIFRINTVFATIAMTSVASAATHTFQNGLNGYNGAQDTNLFHPAGGEGNYNVGGDIALYFGYSAISILSFDLSSLAGLEVVSATLTLHIADTSDNGESIPVQLFQITDGNAGWQQGSHVYTDATASNGNATGINKSHPGTPWTGATGLYEPGIDFVETPIATAAFDFSPSAEGAPLVFNLPAATVQHWIDSVNAGLILTKPESHYARAPQVYSSEYGVQDYRPKLEVTVVPEPATGLMLTTSVGLLVCRRRSAN